MHSSQNIGEPAELDSCSGLRNLLYDFKIETNDYMNESKTCMPYGDKSTFADLA